MRNSVKEIIYTVGDSTGTFARSVGRNSSRLARRVGKRSASLARDIGPARLLVGAAMLAVAIGGGVLLVRYLRQREQDRYDEESMQEELLEPGVRRRRGGRFARGERGYGDVYTR